MQATCVSSRAVPCHLPIAASDEDETVSDSFRMLKVYLYKTFH